MNERNYTEIIFALRKSKARQKILEYLISIYPSGSYASEIARRTGLRLNKVCGALNGSPNRYKKEISLVGLGIVKKEKKKNMFLYKVTTEGISIWNSLGT